MCGVCEGEGVTVSCGGWDDNESWLNAHIKDGSALSRAEIKREITAVSPRNLNQMAEMSVHS